MDIPAAFYLALVLQLPPYMLGRMSGRHAIHKKTVVLLVGTDSRFRFRSKNAIGWTGRVAQLRETGLNIPYRM